MKSLKPTFALVTSVAFLVLVGGTSAAWAQSCSSKSSSACSAKSQAASPDKQLSQRVRVVEDLQSACSNTPSSCRSVGQSVSLAGTADNRIDVGSSGNSCSTAANTCSQKSQLATSSFQIFFEETIRGEQGLPENFALQNIHGESQVLTGYSGKPLALAFLCSHSRESLPDLVDLQKKYQSQGLMLVPVCYSDGSTEDLSGLHLLSKATEFCESLLVHRIDRQSRNSQNHGVTTFYLIDAAGRLLEKLVGSQSKEILDEAFRNLVRRDTRVPENTRGLE